MDAHLFRQYAQKAEAAVSGGDAALAAEWRKQALALYGGDLLPQDLCQEWTEAERERLRRSALRLLMESARDHFDRFHYRTALDHADRLLEMEPWDEEAYLLKIRAHLALGERARALKAFQKCEHALREELGVSPGPKFQALIQHPAAIG